jgi:signal transduction histidine kinase
LTVILGEAQLGMRADDMSDDDTRESMALIHTRARRLNRRIDDLLRVARSESGEIDLANAPFDLHRAASDAIDDLDAVARRRGIELALKADAGTMAQGDEDWTRQVVSGLIDNALRHSPDNTPIFLTITREGDRLCLAVADAGSGVAATDQAQVFQRFRRGVDATERTGFGVGLSLAKWIIERQGGEIELESPIHENKGTRVTLHLPCSTGEDQNDGEACPHSRRRP